MNDPFANVPCLDVDPEIFYPGEWRAPSSADDALAICGMAGVKEKGDAHGQQFQPGQRQHQMCTLQPERSPDPQ